ncbi:MAG: hypothetical protein JSS49_09020 [Planctomycetes bacterium]|nr:hypothetical protein [Planctomycetota bacterium]
MLHRIGLILMCLIVAVLIGTANGQETPPEQPTSVRLSQPIPVTMRLTKGNAVMQAMLLSVDENGISVMTAQGRTVDFANSAVKTVRSADGSIFYTPAKDDANELIQRLTRLQPSTNSPNSVPGQPTGSVPAQPPMTSGLPGFGPGRIPFRMGGSAPAGGHSQMPAMPSMPKPPNFSNPPMNSMAHAQSPGMPSGMPPGMPAPPSAPAGSHMQFPQTPPNLGMPPNARIPPHVGMPPNPGMPPNMGMQTIWEYQCLSCRHKFTSTTEIHPGSRCPKCNILITSVNGKTSPNMPISAYRAGSIVGAVIGVGIVILAIVAIVVRSTS